jgi:hypothetical protein
MNRALDVEIMRAMTELVEAAPVARAVEALEPPQPGSQRHRAALIAVIATMVVAAAGGAVWWKTIDRSPTRLITSTSPTGAEESSVPASVEDPTSTSASDVPVLPEGLVVWNIGEGAIPNQRHAAQLFGKLDDSGTTLARGFLVTAAPAGEPGLTSAAEPVAVRGTNGVSTNVGGFPVLQWVENGIRFDAYSRTLSTEQIVAAIDPMALRLDGRISFEPSTAPAALPLLVESESGSDTISRSTYFRLGPDSDPNADSMNLAGDARLTISDWADAGQSPGMIIALGVKQPDGSYEAPISAYLPEQQLARFVLDPGRSVVTVNGVDATQRQAILDALGNLSVAQRETLRNDASQRLALLPELARETLPTGTIVLRGGTLDRPTALCLSVDAAEACQLASLTSPIAPVAHAPINGKWYFFGLDLAAPQALVDCTAAWPGNVPLAQAIPRDTLHTSTSTFWIATIPPESSCIRIGKITKGSIDLTGISGGSIRPS